jgi:hypothetical protein
VDLQSKAAGGGRRLQTSVWFGSLDVLDFQQEPDQRFLLCLHESAMDIACATEELPNPDSDCQDRCRWSKGKVAGFGLESFCAASLRSAAKWKKYEEIWEQLGELGGERAK